MPVLSRLPVLALLALPALGVVGVPVAPASAAAAPAITVGGVPLAGATVSGTGTVGVIAPGAVSARFTVDGQYAGRDTALPLQWRLSLPAGAHVLRVRTTDAAGAEASATVSFSVAAAATTGGTTAPVGTVVRTADALRAALAAARPGGTITVADGVYATSGSWTAAVSGTAAAPITLRGSRAAVLRSTGTSGGYGLHVTGSYWHVEGLTVAWAAKGIVLDRSVGTVLTGVDVHDTGEEGVHFRTCSSGSALRGSSVHATGLVHPEYGEGVYVGSASSTWATTACDAGRDGTRGVVVEGNVFRDVPAEGADLKEGTTGGVLRANLFDHVGWSGANSADSAVDAKGDGWLVEGNRVTGAAGSFLDGFQTHQVAAGWGTGNVFRGNTVDTAVRGYGFALTPALANVVECSNRASGAARGLATVPCAPVTVGAASPARPGRSAVLRRPTG